MKPSEIPAPGEATVSVPPDAFPGNYAVSLSGEHLLGTKRFLIVEPPKEQPIAESLNR
jgi:hypothetical protein